MNYLLSDELRKATLQYLSQRPIAEADALFHAIAGLQEIPTAPQEGQDE